MTSDNIDRIERFRALLAESAKRESKDPAPVITWLEARRAVTTFSPELIPLAEVRGWARDEATGNIRHHTGEFFSIEGVRTSAAVTREVSSWDQPILNQKEGGVLGILCRNHHGIIEFLIQAKAEPGNIGILQLCPTLQSTMSNLKRAHGGKRSPLADMLLDDTLAEVVYQANHNEEGGRFWRKSNTNRLVMARDPDFDDVDHDNFHWCTLGQVKTLMLHENLVSPFVKTILAPL